MQVRDSESRRPVENAVILDARGVFLAETHMQGKAWFEYNSPNVMVDIVMQGFQKKRAYLTASTGTATLVLLIPDTSVTPEAIVRASRSVQNLSSSQLRQENVSRTNELQSLMPAANTLQDLVSNLSVTQASEDPVLGSSVGINGLGGQNVKLLVDGQPVTGRMSGNIDLSQFSLSDIQTVQVYFGPQSIIYGSDASGGIINLVSFQHDQKVGGYIQGYTENIGRYNFDGHINFNAKGNHIGLKIGRYYFDGLKLYDSLERRKSWLPKEQYFGGLQWSKKWTLNKGTFLAQVRYDYYDEKLYNPGEPNLSGTQQTATAFDYTYNTRRNNGSAILSYWGDKWKHNLQTSYSSFDRNTKAYFLDFVQGTKEDISEGKYDKFDLIQSRYIAQNRSDKLGLQLGAEVNFEKGDGDKLSSAQDRQEYALFGMANYRLGGWHLIPGLRWSYYSSSPSQVIPAFQVTHKISDKWYIEGGYAYAYRVPSLKEMYLSFVDINHNITGNPDLKAESTHSLSGGIKYQIDELKYKLSVKLSAAYYDSDDKIVLAATQSSANSYSYQNVESIQNTSQVLEINFEPYTENHEISLKSSTNWLYYLQYGQAQNEQSWAQNFQFDWRYLKWKAGLSLSSKTSFSQRLFVIDTEGIVARELQTFTMLNLGFSKRLAHNRLVAELGIKNLLDVNQVNFKDGLGNVGVGGSAHGNSGSNVLASPGRAFYLRLGYKF